MDFFKRKQMENTGPGGLACSCCNSFFGKCRKMLNRIARAKLKQDLKKEKELY